MSTGPFSIFREALAAEGAHLTSQSSNLSERLGFHLLGLTQLFSTWLHLCSITLGYHFNVGGIITTELL